MKNLSCPDLGLLFLRSVTIILVLTACASSSSESEAQLSPTVYYKPIIRQQDHKCALPNKVVIRGPKNEVLGQVCPEVFKACLLQGSCVVEEGQKWTSYNYHSEKEGTFRFIKVDRKKCPFGFGVKSICLDPYFSVAADLAYFSAGDVLFIPKLVGVRLPTGEFHDGFVVVRDRGGSIKGPDRVDFFIGYSKPDSDSEVFTRLGLGDKSKYLTYRKANATETELVLKSRNYPSLKPGLSEKIPF